MTNSFWAGRKVWISGASSGIGAALAEELATFGADLQLSARSEDKLRTLAERIKEKGGSAEYFTLDVTDKEQFSRIPDYVRGVDTLVACAGNYFPTNAQTYDSKKYEDLIKVNLFGLFRTIEVVLPSMIKRGQGKIVGVASVVGYRGTPNASVYGASKAAMINFLESLRFDLKPKGVDVVIVNPGFVETPLTEQNTFKMPFLIDSEEAARQIRLGLEKGNWEIHFPKKFTYILKFLRIVPYRAYHFIFKNFVREQR